MENIVKDILSLGNIQQGCRCEDNDGRLSLAIRHNETACMVKITENLIRHLNIGSDEVRTDDCVVVYTSCNLHFRLIIAIVELKVSRQLRGIDKAKRQLRTLIRSFRNYYNSEWDRILRDQLVIALIVHNRPAIVDGARECLEGIDLYYLKNPASDKKFRDVLRKALESRNLPGEVI